MTGRSFALVGFNFILSALSFHFQHWPATFLFVLSVDEPHQPRRGQGRLAQKQVLHLGEIDDRQELRCIDAQPLSRIEKSRPSARNPRLLP